MQNQNDNDQDKKQDDSKTNFWIAVVCFVLGGVALGLCYTVLGVYALFSSMILELAAVTFLNAQKKHNYFLLCKILRVLSYVIMLVAFGLVVGLIAYKA
jgi:cytochrome c oxidase assembly protein Cox11